MSHRQEHIAELVLIGAKDLLARAEDSRRLSEATVALRVHRVLEKYILRDDPNAPDEAIKTFIEGLQSDDLCLVLACEGGVESAWSDLIERFSATVRSAARAASSNEAAAEELAQSVWAELHGLKRRDDGSPAGKLAYYSGRGSLAGWLRAVVSQLAVDQHRKQSRLVQTEEDTEFERLANEVEANSSLPTSVTQVTPEQSVSNKFATEQIRDALVSAVEALSDDDRLLVKLYYFDDLRLREAGAVLGVHEATASRRLTRVQTELRGTVKRSLIEKHGWTQSEAERAFAEVALALESDLEGLLGSQNVGQESFGTR
ncbi:MAG TPA: sigma-70 family RNA polymerase sigma factor [Pyrinomonadaceae bacterium]|nr:sigma-70 family RNA polymerase sigma factor [Pyrinomonadaceae bacterium]